MNLIEQLGGYEKAKAIVDKAPCKTYTFYNHPYQKGYIRCFGGDGKEYFLVSDIEEALLECRRQHNIFEHGDYIVWLFDYEPSHLYTVKNITEKGYDYGNDWGWYGVLSNEGVGYNFRHATNEEIKAGKRL